MKLSKCAPLIPIPSAAYTPLKKFAYCRAMSFHLTMQRAPHFAIAGVKYLKVIQPVALYIKMLT